MRHSHWEYLGFVLVGIGAALAITGTVTWFYFQQYRDTNPQYHSYPLPLLITGPCLVIAGIAALIRARMKKQKESFGGTVPIPPPPPPPQ